MYRVTISTIDQTSLWSKIFDSESRAQAAYRVAQDAQLIWRVDTIATLFEDNVAIASNKKEGQEELNGEFWQTRCAINVMPNCDQQIRYRQILQRLNII